jgi:hypothetical protein
MIYTIKSMVTIGTFWKKDKVNIMIKGAGPTVIHKK